MPPGEYSKRPVQGRQPYPRRRLSIDGVKPVTARRPVEQVSNARDSQPPVQSTPAPSSVPTAPRPMNDIRSLSVGPQIQQLSRSLPTAPPEQSEDELFESLRPSDEEAAKPFVAPTLKTDIVTPTTPEPAEPTLDQVSELKIKQPKKRRSFRLLKRVIFILLIAGLFGGGAFALLRYETLRNDPTRIFKSALQAALSTSQLETKTTIGANSTDVSLDFSVPTNILASNQANINLAGTSVALNGYGSAKNTYISYQQLPAATSKELKKTAQNVWVQLRANGKLPAGVSSTLTNVADPRYLAFGPVVFGNFLPKTTTQLTNYAESHKIYGFNSKSVTHTTKDGTAVLAYPVKLDISNLKILNDSAASSEGFNPGDVQAAVNKFDAYKGGSVTMYVTDSGHQFMGVDITLASGSTISIRYSNVDHVSLPNEPQTRLTWNLFSETQLAIEAQAASSLSAAQVDSLREARLTTIHTYLTAYFADNNAYPTFVQLNDQTWLQNNLAGLDPDALHDPLATKPGLATTTAPKNFAYEPLAADGKSACDNLTQNCNHYNLTTILSTGKPYTVHDP